MVSIDTFGMAKSSAIDLKWYCFVGGFNLEVDLVIKVFKIQCCWESKSMVGTKFIQSNSKELSENFYGLFN